MVSKWRYFLLIIICLSSLLSCKLMKLSSEIITPSEVWESNKGYYNHQVGAYIDGEEFHNRTIFGLFHGPQIKYGFYLQRKNGYVSIGTLSLCMENIKNTIAVYPEIYIVMDSLSFAPGTTFYFNGTGREMNWSQEFMEGNIDCFSPLPYVSGVLWNGKGYVFTNGKITFAEFDQNNFNSQTVYFEFTAVDEDGNTVEVKDGYCKK